MLILAGAVCECRPVTMTPTVRRLSIGSTTILVRPDVAPARLITTRPPDTVVWYRARSVIACLVDVLSDTRVNSQTPFSAAPSDGVPPDRLPPASMTRPSTLTVRQFGSRRLFR